MPRRNANIAKTGNSRVFITQFGPGPTHIPEYQGLARALGLSWPQGDVSPIRIPSADAFDRFDIVDVIKGQQGLPSISVEFRSQMTASEVLAMVKRECENGLYILFGACSNPNDLNNGWIDGHILYIDGARPTDYTTSELGALDSDQRAAVMETVPFTGLDVIDIKPISAQERATTEVTDEVIDVAICDSRTCGACGIPSDGCDVQFALVGPTAGSPGLQAELLYSADGGATWARTNITTLGLAEAPNAMACVGQNLVVVSNDSGSLHYASIADILAGSETWTEVSTGFEVGGEPNAIFSASATKTWIVGDGGHIYFTADPTSGVTVQDAGNATSADLSAVHGLDDLNVVAVGASNAVVATDSGGDSWAAFVGPAPAVALNSVWVHGRSTWFIGTAGGELHYTINGGGDWFEKAFPASGAGQVRDIKFANAAVGYIAHDTATPAGRVLRTIDGGQSWYVLPEKSGVTLPANDRINKIGVCVDDPNVVVAGGLGDNGTDGILLTFA